MRVSFISHERFWSICKIAGACTLMLGLAGITGCGVTLAPSSANLNGEALQGQVFGGQQPVSGASILLYAAGSSGDGTGATNLLLPNIVTTDASGTFSISNDYTCPSFATQVYLVALGGNPGLSTGVNPAIALMAALGNCGSLSSSTRVIINEATTAAAAWALAQFLGPGANIGASATNSTGLSNAFTVAANLVNTATGTAPGATLPSGAETESAKLYTLADVLAACVNSDGTTACTPLFAASTTANGTPTNTLDAARNIVLHPQANIAAVYSAALAQGPFQPQLGTQPNDWTMSITYAGGSLNFPSSLAIDSNGNAWIANYFGAVVSEFSPTGAASAFPGLGLSESYGITIDGSNNVWVTNEQSVTGANNHHQGSITKFSSLGAELSGYGYTAGGIYYPLAAAADTNGAIWIADYGNSSATLLNNDGTPVSGSGGFGPSQIVFTGAVALDASHNAWFAIQKGAVQVTPAGVVNAYTCCSDPDGVAVDLTGNVWFADYSASTVVELSSGGAVLNRTTLSNGKAGPLGIAVDGTGNIWAGDYFGNSFAELSGSTAALLSPVLGFGLDAPLNSPYGLAIDASGNLWLSNADGNTVTQMVGLANPIRTPLLGPPVQP